MVDLKEPKVSAKDSWFRILSFEILQPPRNNVRLLRILIIFGQFFFCEIVKIYQALALYFIVNLFWHMLN